MIDHLTKKQQSLLATYRSKWIEIGLSCGPCNFDEAKSAAVEAYSAAGLPPPQVFFWFQSPMSAAIGASLLKELMSAKNTGVWDSVPSSVRSSVGASVPSSVGASVRASVRDSVGASVPSSVPSSVGASVRASVRDSVGASVWASVRDSVPSSVGDSVRSSVWDSVRSSVWDSVGASVWDSVWASVRASVRDSVWASVGASVRDSVWDSVRSSVWDSVGASVRDSVWASVGASVGASVRDSVWASVWASVRSSVWDSVLDSVRDSVWASAGEMVYGSHDVGFLGWCEYCRDALGIPGASRASGLIRLGKCCGWWAPYQNVVIFQDRHESLRRDDAGRLHREDGPAVAYGDGWSVWAIHGVRVDEQVVMRPETQTVEQMRREGNEEVRRVRIERFGWGRYLDECGAKVIDRRRNDIDTQRETLYQVDGGSKRLRVRDPSTGREYALGVPRDVDTCEAAQRWLSHGLSDRCIGRT